MECEDNQSFPRSTKVKMCGIVPPFPLAEFVTCEACVRTSHRSQYAAITMTTSCTTSTYLLL